MKYRILNTEPTVSSVPELLLGIRNGMRMSSTIAPHVFILFSSNPSGKQETRLFAPDAFQ